MKIQYASDLHLEFELNSRYMQAYGLEPKGDILLLAGDVSYLSNPRMEKDPFFDWCSRHYQETIIVPGNHEYYRDPLARENRQSGVHLDMTLIDYEHRVRGNVRYLNNRSMVFGDVEIFATTLWTITDPGNYVDIQTRMNDCHQIIYKDHILWADDFTEVHGMCKNWLDKALAASKAHHRIVLTHHCPSMRREFDFHPVGSNLYSAFHVDMERFIEEHDIEYWVYGHTHTQDGSGISFPSAGKETTLLCNQLGYVQLNEQQNGFSSRAFFELQSDDRVGLGESNTNNRLLTF